MKYLFKDCVIDVGARRLERNGTEVHVEPQVFDLLLFLIETGARVAGKEEIVARIWKGRAVSDATIASRVNAARRAVGDDGRRQEIIATRARQGFQFVAKVEKEDAGLGRPTVAVMPFDVAPDGDLRLLSRGLADLLAATLGQAAWLDVRDTSASHAPGISDLPPADAGQKLNARYLLEGSLQKSGDALRLALRLVEAETGRQIGAWRQAGTLDALFDMHDALAKAAVGEIEPRLRKSEFQRSAQLHGDHTAFQHYLRATELLRDAGLPEMIEARSELGRATALQPEYAAAHGMMAWIATMMIPQGGRVDANEELARCRLALQHGAFDADALAMAGYALGFFTRDSGAGLDHVRRALAINPSSVRAHDHAGWLLLYSGRPLHALEHFERGVSLCPIDEFAFRMLTGRAFARLFLRQFEEAAEDALRANTVAPSYSVCHRVLAAALAHLEREKEARRVMARMLDINPGLKLGRYARETRFEHGDCREILFDGLARAGMPR